jgi:hypothetical protein
VTGFGRALKNWICPYLFSSLLELNASASLVVPATGLARSFRALQGSVTKVAARLSLKA